TEGADRAAHRGDARPAGAAGGLHHAAGKFAVQAQGRHGQGRGHGTGDWRHGASDEIVKGSMAGYVFEHMEIASYRTLIAAAEAARRPGDAGGLRADPGRGGSDGALAAGPPAGRHPAVPGARRYPRGHGEEVVVAT